MEQLRGDLHGQWRQATRAVTGSYGTGIGSGRVITGFQ